MAPDEEEEALHELRLMPNNSAESIISAAEKIGIFSPPQSPLHIQVINMNYIVILCILVIWLESMKKLIF